MTKFKGLKVFIVLALVLNFSSLSFALNQPHHKKVTALALAYMGSEYATPEQKRAYDFYVKAPIRLEDAQELIGQAAYNVDSFKDTRMGAWWVGYHYSADELLWFMDNNYTSFWHFVTMTRGKDIHGNPHGGFAFKYRTKDPGILDKDLVVKAWLWNQQLKEDDYNVTEAHYRNGSFSQHSQYKIYQDIEFQPVTNLGNYWYQQFKARPSYQSIGYVCHALQDSGVAQHVYNTVSNRHTDYEQWLQDYNDKENFCDFAAASKEMTNFPTNMPVIDLMTKLASLSYSNPEPLYKGSYDAQLKTAKIIMPKIMAATVTLLTKAVNDIYGGQI